jgi:hypothetical protein
VDLNTDEIIGEGLVGPGGFTKLILLLVFGKKFWSNGENCSDKTILRGLSVSVDVIEREFGGEERVVAGVVERDFCGIEHPMRSFEV